MHEAGWTLAFLPRTDRHLVLASHNGPESCVTSTGKREAGEGVPQGSSIGPLLANIYLDYAFDLWARAWRHRQARGDVIVVRFADDIVMGFQHRTDAERFLQELRERLAKFKLELHPDKTRLIEFGRLAAKNRQQRGQRREQSPKTFPGEACPLAPAPQPPEIRYHHVGERR